VQIAPAPPPLPQKYAAIAAKTTLDQPSAQHGSSSKSGRKRANKKKAAEAHTNQKRPQNTHQNKKQAPGERKNPSEAPKQPATTKPADKAVDKRPAKPTTNDQLTRIGVAARHLATKRDASFFVKVYNQMLIDNGLPQFKIRFSKNFDLDETESEESDEDSSSENDGSEEEGAEETPPPVPPRKRLLSNSPPEKPEAKTRKVKDTALQETTVDIETPTGKRARISVMGAFSRAEELNDSIEFIRLRGNVPREEIQEALNQPECLTLS